MKKMTCKQLGGPESCNTVFEAETFEEMAEKSKEHGMKMFQEGDSDHIAKMVEMKEKSKDPEAVRAWFSKKKKEFEELPEEN